MKEMSEKMRTQINKERASGLAACERLLARIAELEANNHRLKDMLNNLLFCCHNYSRQSADFMDTMDDATMLLAQYGAMERPKTFFRLN